eukprot:CAMPEP_0168737160 /NCGR_PEP_ID=MMETSP0724-20121128/10242_1 /TAXON_ID=265536 /ORGANISM="Amphiprora sp., Strain CCMP467" /LENGTH=350 /DNA_ID=CAMNT_0008784399 /DNA_START=40 /DNA_END=1092 /DNA_ORIENTATION=+
MRKFIALLINLWLIATPAHGFAPSSCHATTTTTSSVVLFATIDENAAAADTTTADNNNNSNEDAQLETTAKGLFKRDRYIATNRFSVRKGKAAKFEKRWATRKSSLAKLEGFRYFHLMRRVTLDDNSATSTYWEGDSQEDLFENYVSFTIWNKKSLFSAWRTGEAFKEAHGGTSIGAFLSTMVSSAMVLRGAPRPAFYDGLLLQSNPPETVPEAVDGWRSVEADGVTMLPAECFVAFQKYFVPSDNAAAFEQAMAEMQQQPSSGSTAPGLVASSVMRRDGQAKGHGIVELQSNEPSYVVTTIFDSQAAYQAWAAANQQQETAALDESLWTRAPETVFYEGTLVLSSPEGA